MLDLSRTKPYILTPKRYDNHESPCHFHMGFPPGIDLQTNRFALVQTGTDMEFQKQV